MTSGHPLVRDECATISESLIDSFVKGPLELCRDVLKLPTLVGGPAVTPNVVRNGVENDDDGLFPVHALLFGI
jgi:hypothetical protein